MPATTVCCNICLENADDAEWSTLTTCGHVYHTACIQRSLTYNKRCPTCRKACKEKDILRLFVETGAGGDAPSPLPAAPAGAAAEALLSRWERMRISFLEEELAGTQSRVDELNARIGDLNQQIEKQGADMANDAKKLHELSDRCKVLAAKRAELKQQVAELRERASKRADEHAADIRARDQIIGNAESAARADKRRLRELEREVGRLKAAANTSLTQPQLRELLGGDDGVSRSDLVAMLAERNAQLQDCRRSLADSEQNLKALQAGQEAAVAQASRKAAKEAAELRSALAACKQERNKLDLEAQTAARDKTALQDEVTALRAQLAAVQPLLAGSRDPHVARHFAGPSRAGGAAAAAAPASSSGRHAAGAGAAASAAAAPSASGREVAAPKGPGAAAAAAAACFARAGSSTAVASFSGRGAAGASNGGDAPSAAAGRSGGSSGDAACTSGRGSPALSASASMLELTAAKVLRRERSGSGPHADGAGTSGAGADDANVHDGWGDDFWQAVGASGSGADGDAAAAADCGADACACSGADSGVANGDDDCTAGEPNDDGGPEEDGALVIDDFDDLPLQRPRAFGNVGSGGAAAPPRFAAIHQSNKSVKNWLAPAAPSVASYFAAPPAWPFGGGGGGGGLIRSGADGRGGMTHVLADATNLMLKRAASGGPKAGPAKKQKPAAKAQQATITNMFGRSN